MTDDRKLEEWVAQLTETNKEEKVMKKDDIDKKQTEISKKVSDAKQTVQKRVTQLNRAPLKKPAEKPKADKSTEEQSWLAKYIADPEQSCAKKVTSLFARAEGCSIDEAVKVATEYGQKKGSKWGQTKGSIKSHLSFLKSKGCDVKEIREGVYKVSQ